MSLSKNKLTLLHRIRLTWVLIQCLKRKTAYSMFQQQARRNQEGGWGGGLQPPQIFAKADLLLIDNDRKKKKIET